MLYGPTPGWLWVSSGPASHPPAAADLESTARSSLAPGQWCRHALGAAQEPAWPQLQAVWCEDTQLHVGVPNTSTRIATEGVKGNWNLNTDCKPCHATEESPPQAHTTKRASDVCGPPPPMHLTLLGLRAKRARHASDSGG